MKTKITKYRKQLVKKYYNREAIRRIIDLNLLMFLSMLLIVLLEEYTYIYYLSVFELFGFIAFHHGKLSGPNSFNLGMGNTREQIISKNKQKLLVIFIELTVYLFKMNLFSLLIYNKIDFNFILQMGLIIFCLETFTVGVFISVFKNKVIKYSLATIVFLIGFILLFFNKYYIFLGTSLFLLIVFYIINTHTIRKKII